MKRKEKETLVEELSRGITDHSSIILTDFTGIDVKGMMALRRALKENQATLRVVKNTLLVRAAGKSSLEEITRSLEGPTALVMSDDPVSGAKVLVDFAKKETKPRIKVAMIEGTMLGADAVKRIAGLPSRQVLLSMFMATLHAPLVQTLRIMSGLLLKLVLVTRALRDEKGREGEGTFES